MPPSLPRLLAAIAASTLLVGCQATVNTRTIDAARALRAEPLRAELRTAPAPTSDAAETLARLAADAGNDPARLRAAALFALRAGDHLRTRDPVAARAFFVSALELSLQAARHTPAPNHAAALETPNVALLQIISLSPGTPPARQTIATPLGARTVTIQSEFELGDFDRIVPASLIRMTGFTYRAAVPGFGVPLVGIKRNSTIPFYEKRGTFSPITAIPEFVSASELRVRLVDPNLRSTIAAPGSTAEVPLAADFTAPLALFFDRLNDLALGLRGLFRVDNQMKLAGLYMVEPYDPDRIPVVMVHGLSSSPLIWRNLINELSLDPAIRRKFQFWVVYYPSGVPTTASAYFLRHQLGLIRQTFDPAGHDLASRDLITIGHSMGGVISRMNAVEIGDRLWRQLSDIPFDQVELDPEDRALIQPRLFWEPVASLQRGIYFSSPHRGAVLADSSLANLGMRFIRFPADVFNYQKRIMASLGSILTLESDARHLTNSIGSLSPRHPVFLALDGAKFRPGYRYHTIVGDRGRGDTPESSDGIVGYWSSHLPGAETELIVPTGHASFEHPDSIQNVRQILHRHLHESPGRP